MAVWGGSFEKGDGVRITVIGGGVVGLSAALRLARRDHRITVVSADPLTETTTTVAGGLIYPRHAEPVERVARWTEVSVAEFHRLAEVPGTGVRFRPGALLRRTDRPMPPWADAVGGMTRDTDVAAPYTDALRCVSPLVNTGRYVAWLEAELRRAGVEFERRTVRALSDVADETDMVVNAAGMDAGRLAGDDTVRPARGQVVHIADPGLTEWIVDEDDFSYVLPHGDHAVCGGTEEFGEDSLEPDPDTTKDILRRCAALLPGIEDAEILRVKVGLRPHRDRIRLDREGDVIHCYGLGGVGVTLSWGCADEVADLAGR
ncbi:FAD-dependent oxidoreductase [Haloechinothrix salitolerans]|uniref:NAD(P)/FAD-dependent oxidoreductase n=1 Tax=Haloechinothrix salitolerans TaxID=926830 RepID=UPI0031EA2EB7